MERYYFGLRRSELVMLVYGSIMVAMLLLPFYWGETIWIGIGLAFALFALGHLCFVATRCVALPELTSFVACINWFVAPMLAYRYPPSFKLYEMSVPSETYFSYAVPCCIALWMGLHLFMRVDPRASQTTPKLIRFLPRDKQFMDALIVVGFLVKFAAPFLPYGFEFLYYILAQLRFVGAFSLLITDTPGWRIRIALVYASLFVSTLNIGLFYELVLWSGYLMILLAYLRKWRMRLLVMMPLIFFLIIALNSIKPAYRAYIGQDELTVSQKITLFSKLMFTQVSDYKSYEEAPNPQDGITRWNQGWIISKVMAYVPESEPYAQGSTVLEAFIAAFVPRVFYPTKITAGSQEIFYKFTGVRLALGTSMALGIAGEMYANFGAWGGIFATFIYGILVGYIFRRFARLASKNFLWWAWTPTVLLVTIEAEWNFVDIINHIFKSLIVLAVFIYAIPSFRKYLSPQFILARFFNAKPKKA